MALESDGVIYLHSGPEIGVASTKTFIAHLTCLYLLGIRLAAVRHRLAPERLEQLTLELKNLPAAVEKVLARAEAIQALARKYSGYRNFMYIGRGINYPIALEGALKLKEISYLHAEGYAGGGAEARAHRAARQEFSGLRDRHRVRYGREGREQRPGGGCAGCARARPRE